MGHPFSCFCPVDQKLEKLLRFLHLHGACRMFVRLRHKLSGHFVAAMAGAAGYGLVFRFGIWVVDLRHELRVDLLRHGDHGAGDGFVGLGVGGKVRLMRLLVHLMAEVAVHAEST
jgi:hypothetical protein